MAENTVDSLRIEVKADTNDAVRGIDNLIKTLDRMTGTSKGGSKGFDAIQKNLSKIANATSALDSGSLSKLQELADGLHALAGLKNLKLGNIADEIFDIAAAIDYLKEVDMSKLTEIADKLPALQGTGTLRTPKAATEPVLHVGTVDSSSVSTAVEHFEEMDNTVGHVQETVRELADSCETLQNALDGVSSKSYAFSFLKKAFDGMLKKVKSLGVMFGRRVLYRAMNALISTVTKGFTDGINAVYRYSSALNGQLAKSLDRIATSFHYLKGSLGAMAAPLFNMLAPVIDTLIDKFVALLNIMNQVFARLSGASTWTRATKSAVKYTGAAKDATKANEKLKKSLLGIDEINALQDNSSSGGASGGGSGDSGYKFEEVPLDNEYADGIIEKMKTVLWYVGAIAAGLTAWKLSKSFLGGLKALSLGVGVTFTVLTVSDIIDVFKNGLDWGNLIKSALDASVAGLGIGFAIGGAGGALIGLTFSLSATMLIESIHSMLSDGINAKNVTAFIVGALAGVLGIMRVVKLFNKKVPTNVPDLDTASQTIDNANPKIDDIGKGTSTLTTKLTTLVKNLALGIAVIAEVIVAVALVVGAVWGLGLMLEQVGIAWQPVIDNGATVAIAMGAGVAVLGAVGAITALLGSVGSELIVNLALGVAMLAIIGVSAGLFIAEIWAIGIGLDQISVAWQPVIDNGDTIATAIGLGTLVLIGVGTATALLGAATVATAGALPLAIALGTALLLELGIVVDVFIAEIIKTGEGLRQIEVAWKPVLDDGERIKKAIETGTTYLVAVGAATALLGVAEVATVGLLPLAIDLGTKMLEKLAKAAVDFNKSLTEVADSFSNTLQPALRRLNDKLPLLSDDMDDFTHFMKFFAQQVVDYSKETAISGFASTVNTIIGFFTKDPIQAMADDVKKEHKQVISLNDKLRLANPELETAIDLIKHYYDFLEELEKLTKKTTNISLANGMFVSMKEVGKNLVLGFIDGMKSESETLGDEVKKVLNDTFTDKLANTCGYNFGKQVGQELGKGVGDGFKTTSFPTLSGKVNVKESGSVSLKLRAYAGGGFPENGEMFIAREAGAELVGRMGNRTAVANNDQIVSGIAEGVSDANAEQNALLREQNGLLRKLLEKDTVVNAVIGASDVVGGLQRKNRRDGKAVVPIGV